MMEISEVRRRLLQRIERARQTAAARRAAAEAAGQDYERFLAEVATPLLLKLSAALRASGCPFQVMTPAGSARLVSEKSADDFVELVFDTSGTPLVLGRSSRGRGRRVLTSERPIHEHTPIASLTEEDVLDFFLAELEPFLER